MAVAPHSLASESALAVLREARLAELAHQRRQLLRRQRLLDLVDLQARLGKQAVRDWNKLATGRPDSARNRENMLADAMIRINDAVT